MTDSKDRTTTLEAAAAERILLLDGAMGTMIQAEGLDEGAYRGRRFARHGKDLAGNNDILNLTHPDLIQEIHGAYLAAGADILKTNTFNATRIAQGDYGLAHIARELNVAGARLARAAADAASTESRTRFVAGVLGPTNRTASISPDVADPGYRNVTFDELAADYGAAADGLIEGGVDLILVETVFDTLNAKAALYAITGAFERAGRRLPILVSGTIADQSGRTLSGQTIEAFLVSVAHVQPFAIGLNCALGAEQLRPFVADLARLAGTRVSAHPNAGLPNQFGEYDETPETTAGHLGEWAAAGLVNLVGGCCGTTPEHIRAIATAVSGVTPRAIPERPRGLRLAGLEPFELVA